MIQEVENTEPSKIHHKIINIIWNEFHNHKIIYCEGSKSNDKSGIAVISNEEVFKFSSLEYNSIFTIEAFIQTVIELIDHYWKTTKSFLIASDSLSYILAIKDHGTTNEIIKISKKNFLPYPHER